MIHLPDLIVDLGIILTAGGLITLVFKKLKQPLVLGYIIAGLLVGPHIPLFPTVTETENVEIWSEIGVIFLLFSLGLEFSFKKLMKVGGSASTTATVEALGMALLGFGIGKLLGWSDMDSIFLGGILSISSTTIIIRAFGELGVKTQKFAGLVYGVLIVEDLIAVLLMVVLSTVAVSQQFAGMEMLYSLLKLVFFLILWFVAGIFFIPTLLKRTKNLMNDETLLIVSLSLCLLMVILATQAGFSKELGAFMMGSILAETAQGEKIEHLIKPLRDLFGTIFFVSVGMLIDPALILEHIGPVLLITLVTIVGKMLTTTAGAAISGQPFKTSVQAGMSMAQIGEFSFIIATLGLSLGVISPFLYPVAVAVSAVTTFTTPYMILISKPLYNKIERWIPESWLRSLERYSAGAQSITALSDWQIVIRSFVSKVIVHSVVLLGLILLSVTYALPWINEQTGGAEWGRNAAALLTLLLMLPFLWALAFQRRQNDAVTRLYAQRRYRGPIWLLRISRMALTVFFIFFLLKSFFSLHLALIAVAVIAGMLFLFSKKVQVLYNRIEQRFLMNYRARELADSARQDKNIELAPWDAHMASLEVHPEAPAVGKTLLELRWREHTGVNIILIKRGERTIPVPDRNERIYPGDELFFIGTDTQARKLQALLRPPRHLETAGEKQEQPEDISLQKVVIKETSPIFNKNIRDSGLRERTLGLVVGIERNGERFLNPESDWVFQEGDVVWIAGDRELIREFGL